MRICFKHDIKASARLHMEASQLVDWDSTPREHIRGFFQLLRHCVETKKEPLERFLQRHDDSSLRTIHFA